MVTNTRPSAAATLPELRTIAEELQQRNFRSDADMAYLNLIYTSNWFIFQVQGYLKQYDGLTMQQYNVLRILRGQHGNPLSLLQVKCRLLDRNSDVSRIIDRMVRKGLISRETCNADRRQVDLTLTPKGSNLLESVGDSINTVLDAFSDAASPAELQHMSDLLDRARAASRKRLGINNVEACEGLEN
jgi:DNA-binding MarR family transcriptional regulator